MTAVIIGISASWKYWKIYNIKRIFLSQICSINEIHVNHINELKKKLWSSNHPLYGHFRRYKYLNCRLWRTDHLLVTPLHRLSQSSRDYQNSCDVMMYHVTTTRHMNGVNNSETTSYSAWRFKSLFRSFAVDLISIGMPNLPAKNIILIHTNQWLALGQVSYGGVQLRGLNPYPILGKAGLRKHTLF